VSDLFRRVEFLSKNLKFIASIRLGRISSLACGDPIRSQERIRREVDLVQRSRTGVRNWSITIWAIGLAIVAARTEAQITGPTLIPIVETGDLPSVPDDVDWAQFQSAVPAPNAVIEPIPMPASNAPRMARDAVGQDMFVLEVRERQTHLPEVAPQSAQTNQDAAVEPEKILTRPWWFEAKQIPIDGAQLTPVELEQLIWQAVENSPYVQALKIQTQIQEARASAALGVFDPTPFVNSVFNDTSNPVGNTLTTGGPPRLNENVWENSGGVKAKTPSGAQTELAQEMNFKDNNSVFFIPHNQADTRIVMRYTQPLMRGAGATYNRSSFVIANLATAASIYDVSQKIQEHAFTISTDYWELFVARAFYQQHERGLARLQQLANQLAGRSDLDSLRSQLFRAEAQISRQKAQLERARAQAIASEAKLRAAVGIKEVAVQQQETLVPITLPADWKPNLSIESELNAALGNHPKVLNKQAAIKSARVKLKVAENELRPTLNLVMEGYARGLNGAYNFGSSLGDQFSQGSPSYFAGLNYQRPFRNVTAKAIQRENRLEMRKALLELDNELMGVSSEVIAAFESAHAAFAELESAVQATLAAHSELEYLQARWANPFLESSQSDASLLLDRLLNANVQLIQSENGWARAEADHMLAIAKLRLASGSLLPMSLAEPN
jgi:outer membrane protein TolC